VSRLDEGIGIRNKSVSRLDEGIGSLLTKKEKSFWHSFRGEDSSTEGLIR
jgi:hypothetical protein